MLAPHRFDVRLNKNAPATAAARPAGQTGRGAKGQRVLDWHPRPPEEAIVAMARSLMAFGVAPERNQRPADETGRARHEHTYVTPFLDLSAVVRPVKDGLSLSPPTFEIARFAVLPNRRHVSSDRTPASNLPGVVIGSAAHVVTAIPLEPPTGILRVDPATAAPNG